MVYLATATVVTETNYNHPTITIDNTDTPYTVDDTIEVILCDCTSSAIHVDLPTAAGRQGAYYNIKKIDSTANAVTIDGLDAETIDGAATQLIYGQYDSYTLVSDGTNWVIV